MKLTCISLTEAYVYQLKMPNILLISALLFTFIPSLSSATSTLKVNSNNSSCPIDFSYVQTFPWYTEGCRDGRDPNTCCQTLRSLLGIGLAIYLNKTSNFYLPTIESASSCLSIFQSKLAAFSISMPLIPSCFNSSDELLNQPTSCAGIRTIRDWTEKAGTAAQLDSSCKGDMGRLTQCSFCLEAGMKLTSQLVSLDPNSTKCFYFTIFYAAGIVNLFGPEDPRSAACILGIPLSDQNFKPSTKVTQKTSFKLVIGLLGALFGVLIIIGSICCYRFCHKKRKERELHDRLVSSVKSQVSPNIGTTWYSVAELERATDRFSSKNFIGQGGYGVVYKGTFPNGSAVAVKQVTEDLDSMRDEEFCNEVEIISKIRHRNLLSLKGCCVASDNFNGKRRYLVYEYMLNGSLSDHLFNNPRKKLTWPERKNIILDVAKGLAYLHYGVKPAIYHRDIKTTNILLDSEMKARVADFGMAKQSIEGRSHLTTRVAGTYGYLAPEYALYGQLTEKSDVYSFGIVILETMSGRKVLDTSNSSPLIADYAWDLVKSGNTNAFFDESIRDEGPKGIMERFVRVGILCAHVMVAFRPSIAQALKMLEGDIDIPKLPSRPLPLGHESFRPPSWRSNSTSGGSFKSSTSSFFP